MNTEKLNKKEDFLKVVKEAFTKEILKKIVFSRPISGEIQKVSGRSVAHRGRRLLAMEYSLPGNTVSHRNIGESELGSALSELMDGYSQANLITTMGDVEWKISKGGKEALLGADKLTRRFTGDIPDFVRAVESLDKQKSYILTGREEFLIRLGISDAGGRVHDKKQGKFRQINRFLEYLEEVYHALPKEGALHILDLCCGKSYLSFAVYHYLTAIKGREVELLGADLKRDVILWCENLAREIGFDGMRFVCRDIKELPRDKTCDMVISLHACDVATDIVLEQAIEREAGVILSTPCCHRYMRDRIKREELSFVTENPHIANKLAEAITDSLRVMRLRAAGYDTVATELTDPDDTPKNTLIKAIKRGAPSEELYAKYQATLRYITGEDADDYLKDIIK